jgi:hypothetical protein
VLQFPELGELQEHRVGVHDRECQSGRAVEDSLAQDEVSQERRGRMEQQVGDAGTAAVLEHLPGRQRRVAVDAIEVVAQVAVRVVQQFVAQASGRSVHLHRLVDVPPGPPGAATIVEACLEIRVEVGRANPASQVIRDAGHAISRMVRRARQQRTNLRRQIGRQTLIGIE